MGNWAWQVEGNLRWERGALRSLGLAWDSWGIRFKLSILTRCQLWFYKIPGGEPHLPARSWSLLHLHLTNEDVVMIPGTTRYFSKRTIYIWNGGDWERERIWIYNKLVAWNVLLPSLLCCAADHNRKCQRFMLALLQFSFKNTLSLSSHCLALGEKLKWCINSFERNYVPAGREREKRWPLWK